MPDDAAEYEDEAFDYRKLAIQCEDCYLMVTSTVMAPAELPPAELVTIHPDDECPACGGGWRFGDPDEWDGGDE